ncbi:roadblock/LC7 domain-containing protein [Candidatus Thiothrix sp. Deng01]|uniref:Roadblock/LC7 domain-containing protein n=1 Tax=Candidatus Thiothrix phosphatis TaxID=3112415 RepID=A0ABU6CXU0_9GAMM|nr:roadblock/LC7 domain-containing protein [Candidatus Thiothrix sp. Deng01]MEB4590929.1 roadblock/LC7 domain-containing protein [Candidatus Thiothrix sp. Deng01]
MLTPQIINQFASSLQRRMPDIENIQIMTVDGLSLYAASDTQLTDTVSALSALLYSAASNLAGFLRAGKSPGMIICMKDFAYIITQLNAECVIGFQVSIRAGTVQTLHAVCDYIETNGGQLSVAY